MRTTADERVASAIDHIQAAIKDLAVIVVDQCHGHDEYKASHKENIRHTFITLQELRDNLQ
jgi:hypothetical protein